MTITPKWPEAYFYNTKDIKMEQTHTPTPYKYVGSKIEKHKEALFIMGNGKFVGKVYGHGGMPAYANARFIVQAVNSYDELIRLCTEAYTMIGEYLIEVGQEEGAANELHNQLGTALAKAKEVQ